MNKDQWTDRLSDYLDGDLAAGERTALEAHLATCGDCRATLADLRRVVARAQALVDQTPKADLWPGVRARLTPGPATVGSPLGRPGVNVPWRVSVSVPQLMAASIALVVLSAGSVWLAVRPRETILTPTPTAFDARTLPPTQVVWRTDRTDAAIAELEAALAQNESRLDTATVRVVRENLAIIDRAVAEARRALAADPGNTYLNLHLADTMRRKVELLRRVNAIAAARS
jgi:hypothetical protein